MSNLLLELYMEEIPAFMQKPAALAYQNWLTTFCHKQKITFDKIEAFWGPCRIALFAQNLELQNDQQVIKGPKKNSDSSVIEGFCGKHKVSVEALEIKIENGVEYYYLNKINTQDLPSLLAQFLPVMFDSYIWPKTMRWGDFQMQWIRPLKNILCLLDGEILPVSYYHLNANNLTFGHKFFNNKAIQVRSFADYQEQLLDAKVVISSDKRQEIISQQISDICQTHAIELNADAKLLEEITGLVEWPVALMGNIPEQFMQLPGQLLSVCLRTHQKYFTCKQNAALANKFIFIANSPTNQLEQIIAGNEKVLAARLSDALYFYQEDLKRSLASRLDDLQNVIFHANLGSMKDKSMRLEAICKHLMPLANQLHLAARLCKCDLISNVVTEFPELEGIISMYYAKADGLGEEVAQIIAYHYAPSGAKDQVPEGLAATLSLVDKLDSTIGLMLAGQLATSSKDPYGLRRNVISILRIIEQQNLSIDLEDLFGYVLNLFDMDKAQDFIATLRAFFLERLKYLLQQKYDTNLVNCLMPKDLSNLSSTYATYRAMEKFYDSPMWSKLLNAYKRIANVLGKSSSQEKLTEQLLQRNLQDPLELALYNQLQATQKSLPQSDDLLQQLNILLGLTPSIEHFFDNVLIHSEDQQVAKYRIALVRKLQEFFDSVMNFASFI